MMLLNKVLKFFSEKGDDALFWQTFFQKVFCADNRISCFVIFADWVLMDVDHSTGTIEWE